MHVEIKYAQNFVLNFLYNKLPRRRVNLFGEELESALRDKFKDHWYPDKPFKGSAFRCLKITDPADPVLNRAARESGNPLLDIIENLPTDLAIWIDPGEVSYRIGEKGSVKILYSEKDGNPFFQGGGTSAGGSSSSLFNTLQHGSSEDPEIAGLLSSENLLSGLSSLSLSQSQSLKNATSCSSSSSPPSPFGSNNNNNSTGNNSNSSTAAPNNTPPVTYTAGMFAQTKFGSTKLKTSGKKTSRMSPTEFSNYIKTRAALQKQQQQQHHHHHHQQQQQPQLPSRMTRPYREEGYFGGSFSSINSTSGSFGDPFKANGHVKPPPSPPSSGSPSSSSWTYASDPETEAFLQDIFSVGLRSQVVDMGFDNPGVPNNNSHVGGFFGGGSFPPRGGDPGNAGNMGGSIHRQGGNFSSFKAAGGNPVQSSDKYQQRILVAN